MTLILVHNIPVTYSFRAQLVMGLSLFPFLNLILAYLHIDINKFHSFIVQFYHSWYLVLEKEFLLKERYMAVQTIYRSFEFYQ